MCPDLRVTQATCFAPQSIYKRYAVVNEADIREGLGRIESWTQKRTQVGEKDVQSADGSGT
jgi:hypothetical protein